MLLGHENLVVAVAISLLSCLQADTHIVLINPLAIKWQIEEGWGMHPPPDKPNIKNVIRHINIGHRNLIQEAYFFF